MPLRSYRFEIWRRLRDRLKLEATGEDDIRPQVSPVVVPTLDVTPILEVPTAGTTSLNISSSNQVAFTVPKGEEWTLVSLYRGLTVGTGGQMHLVIGGIAHRVSAAGSAENVVDGLGQVLREGDEIVCTNAGNGADTAIVCSVSYGLIDLST